MKKLLCVFFCLSAVAIFFSFLSVICPDTSLVSANDNDIKIEIRLDHIEINLVKIITHTFSKLFGLSQNQESQPVQTPASIFCCSPHDCTVNEGQILSFFCHFHGAGDSSYQVQWEYQAPGSQEWIPSVAQSAHDLHLHYIAEGAFTGRLYRAVVQNIVTGEIFYSSPAHLIVIC